MTRLNVGCSTTGEKKKLRKVDADQDRRTFYEVTVSTLMMRVMNGIRSSLYSHKKQVKGKYFHKHLSTDKQQ
jgi:hypothetical protein